MAGSVIVVDEVPDEAVSTFLELFLSRNKIIEELDIQKIQLAAEDEEYKEAFCSYLAQRLKDDKERAVIYGLFVHNLEPREIYRAEPSLFKSVEDVQITKEKVLGRLSGFPTIAERLHKIQIG